MREVPAHDSVGSSTARDSSTHIGRHFRWVGSSLLHLATPVVKKFYPVEAIVALHRAEAPHGHLCESFPIWSVFVPQVHSGADVVLDTREGPNTPGVGHHGSCGQVSPDLRAIVSRVELHTAAAQFPISQRSVHSALGAELSCSGCIAPPWGAPVGLPHRHIEFHLASPVGFACRHADVCCSGRLALPPLCLEVGSVVSIKAIGSDCGLVSRAKRLDKAPVAWWRRSSNHSRLSGRCRLV